MWAIFAAFAIPEIGTLIRAVRICFFKSSKRPSSTQFIVVSNKKITLQNRWKFLNFRLTDYLLRKPFSPIFSLSLLVPQVFKYKSANTSANLNYLTCLFFHALLSLESNISIRFIISISTHFLDTCAIRLRGVGIVMAIVI